MPRSPSVIIIPCYRHAAVLPRLLEALEVQETPLDFEVLVVESGGDEAARLVGERFPEVGVLSHGHRLFPGAARNRGAAAAKGACLAFVDADAVPEFGGGWRRSTAGWLLQIGSSWFRGRWRCRRGQARRLRCSTGSSSPRSCPGWRPDIGTSSPVAIPGRFLECGGFGENGDGGGLMLGGSPGGWEHSLYRGVYRRSWWWSRGECDLGGLGPSAAVWATGSADSELWWLRHLPALSLALPLWSAPPDHWACISVLPQGLRCLAGLGVGLGAGFPSGRAGEPMIGGHVASGLANRCFHPVS